jgi:hypothetical protein
MRTQSRIGLALGVALLAAPLARAQAQPQPVQPQPAQPQPARLIAVAPNNPQLTLLSDKGVQEDLKLSAEQVKKVGELNEKQKEVLKGVGRDRLAKAREFNDTVKKTLESFKPEQTRRLDQLQLQQRGPNAFFDPRVRQGLNLTAEQQAQVRQAIQDSAQKRAQLIRAAQGNREEVMKKTQELNRVTVEEIVKSLTDEQKTRWKDLAGEPYKGTLPGPALPGAIRLPAQPLQPRNPPGILPVQPRQIQPVPAQRIRPVQPNPIQS